MGATTSNKNTIEPNAVGNENKCATKPNKAGPANWPAYPIVVIAN